MNFIPLKADHILSNRLNRDEYSSLLIQNEIGNIKKVIRSWSELDDYTKFKFITNYYVIKSDLSDVYDLINMYNETNYSKVVDVATRMETEDFEYKGHGKNFKWWPTYNRVHYICAIENKKHLPKKLYSREEFIELIKQKEIFPIKNYLEDLYKPSENKENYQYVKMAKSYGIEIDDFDVAFQNNGKPFKDNSDYLIPENEYYDISVSEDHIANFMSLVEKYIDEKTIKENCYYYLKSLIKLVEKEGNDKDKQELIKLYDLVHEKDKGKSRIRTKNNE